MRARLPEHAELLGPVDLPGAHDTDADLLRLTVRAPRAAAADLARAAKEVSSIRSARKSDGALRVIVDPVSLA